METTHQENSEVETADPVRDLLGRLERVEAPADFEQNVMRRVRAGEPVSERRTLLPIALRYAVPLVLVLLIVGAVLYNSYRSRDVMQPVVKQQLPQQPEARPQPVIEQNTQAPGTEEQVAKRDQSVRPPVVGDERANGRSKKQVPIPRGGSYDEGVKPAPSKYPRSTNSTYPNDMMTSTSLPVRDVLAEIGITASFNGGWKVSAVRDNSPAKRSGVTAGDIVVALDEQVLSEHTEFRRSVAASSLRVERGGKLIDIKLK